MLETTFGNKMERAQESDLDELIPMVNEAFQVETGNTGSGFKCANRIPTREVARSLFPDLYILRESGEVIGCVHSPVTRSPDGTPESVYIGMLTVKATHQGKGIGSRILSFSESLAPLAKMNVVECRDELFPYYKKKGYIEVGTTSVLDVIKPSEVTRPDLKMVFMEKKTGFSN